MAPIDSYALALLIEIRAGAHRAVRIIESTEPTAIPAVRGLRPGPGGIAAAFLAAGAEASPLP